MPDRGRRTGDVKGSTGTIALAAALVEGEGEGEEEGEGVDEEEEEELAEAEEEEEEEEGKEKLEGSFGDMVDAKGKAARTPLLAENCTRFFNIDGGDDEEDDEDNDNVSSTPPSLTTISLFAVSTRNIAHRSTWMSRWAFSTIRATMDSMSESSAEDSRTTSVRARTRPCRSRKRAFQKSVNRWRVR